MIAQIQREGEFKAWRDGLDVHRARRMAHPEKSGESPAFGLEGIHGKGLLAAAAGMHHMILKTACRSLHPGIDYIECQRRVNTDRRMQRRPGLPGAVTHAGDEFTFAPRRAAAVPRGSCKSPRSDRARVPDLDLHALQRGIHVARRTAGCALLAHDMPGLERLTQLEQSATRGPSRRASEIGIRNAAQTN